MDFKLPVFCLLTCLTVAASAQSRIVMRPALLTIYEAVLNGCSWPRCLMQTASAARPASVSIDKTRPKADREAATMRSFKGGCLAARLTVELMTCKLATSCELSVGKITRV